MQPLRKKYGITTSLTIGLIILALVLIALNVIFVTKTDYGASFYSYWLSSRVLFAQGGNPYGTDLFTQVIERFPDDPNVSGFTLPLYSAILVLPLSFIDNFEIALVIWMIILEAAMIFCGIKLKSALQIDNRSFQTFTIAILLLISYYSIMALIDGEMNIIAIAFLIIGLDAIRENEDEFAGIMLAFATVKFNLTLLPILWICLWCLTHKRGTVVAWIGMVWVLLALLATLLMTNWITEGLRSVVYYYKYLNPLYLSRLIENWQPELGGRIGWALSGIFIAIMLLEWVINARKGVRAFEWVLALTMTIAFLCGSPSIGKNLFALWIPAIYALDKIVRRWIQKGWQVSNVITILALIIPWILHLFVFARWDDPIEILNIVLPISVVIILYWNRWWNIDTFIESY